jgi:hypothetical protein
MLKVIDVVGRETKSLEIRQKLAYHVNLIQLESKAGSLVEPDKHLIQLNGDALQVKLKAAV